MTVTFPTTSNINRMAEEFKNTLSNSTTITIGVTTILVSGIVWVVVAVTTLQAAVSNNQNIIFELRSELKETKSSYVDRAELLYILQPMQDKINNIEKVVTKGK